MLRATEQPIDTGTAAGKAFLDMLGVFAEFETNLRKERQAEGIAAAKARGVVQAAEVENRCHGRSQAPLPRKARASRHRTTARHWPRQCLSGAWEEGGIAMPIRPELRPLYPPHWRRAEQPRSLRARRR